jgi:HSP20 family protein
MTYTVVKPGEQTSRASEVSLTPAVDIVEGPESFVIHLDLPGFEKDDVKVVVNDGVLAVSGERDPTKWENEDFYRYFERPAGKFYRTFRIPEDTVDSGEVKATYRNGVLTLELRKKEKAKPKTIAVN